MEKTLHIGDFDVAVDFHLDKLPEEKLVINTINAYSWTMTDRFPVFKKALQTSDILLPDGVSIVFAAKLLTKQKIKKTAGADLHYMALELLNKTNGSCFYLGAAPDTLKLIKTRINKEYPHIRVGSYSPPFKDTFTEDDNTLMKDAINRFAPDIVFVGMTAPKQETWIYNNHQDIRTKIICGIGAVFDFYAETTKRPPRWMIDTGLEWFGRLLMNPRRLWKRYIVYNVVFVYKIGKLYFIKLSLGDNLLNKRL